MNASSGTDNPAVDEIDPPPAIDNWLDLIDHLTGELAANNEGIECELEDVTLDIPMRMSADAETACWKFDGDVTIQLGEVQVPLEEWRQYWNATD